MNHEPVTNAIETMDYIAACELAECRQASHGHPLELKAGLLRGSDVTDSAASSEGAERAAVVASTLIAFAGGISRQSKEDVMDSFLFATLVANKAFSAETQGAKWYDKFNEVLSTIGWLSTQWNYARYRATQQRFTMDEVGLEILGSAVAAAALPGPASLLMRKVAGDAIAALQAKKEPLRLFESQSRTQRGGSFRIASCIESDDKDVSLAMGAVSFRTNSDVTNVLFWEWEDTHVETWKGENSMVLNTSFYARHRKLIQRRLDENVEIAIMEFKI